jgi:hypothetical protein
MASLAEPRASGIRDDGFFFGAAIAMTAIVVSGFSLHLALGRSTFGVPWPVHVHAVLFFAWTFFYLLQNALVATGSVRLHRRLGWAALAIVPAMLVVGTGMTVASVRNGTVPFFFTPAYFLVLNPLSLLVFAALVGAAIRLRRATAWHRRLMFCAMALLLGPAFGRLLPLPLTIPWAGLTAFAGITLFPIAGMVADGRRTGKVHPAWFWGFGAIVGFQIVSEVAGRSAPAAALARAVSTGAPGESIDPLAYPAPPAPALIAER